MATTNPLKQLTSNQRFAAIIAAAILAGAVIVATAIIVQPVIWQSSPPEPPPLTSDHPLIKIADEADRRAEEERRKNPVPAPGPNRR